MNVKNMKHIFTFFPRMGKKKHYYLLLCMRIYIFRLHIEVPIFLYFYLICLRDMLTSFEKSSLDILYALFISNFHLLLNLSWNLS